MTAENPAADASQARQNRNLAPGARIGMVGGGQLGRMFAMAASAMGYHVSVLCDDENEPAAQVAESCVDKLTPSDDVAIRKFAEPCDVITLEFENIDRDVIDGCARFAPTYPSASVLAAAQDRLVEKGTLRDAGLPVTPFVEVNDESSLLEAGDTLGWPLIVKTARSGYDGKGQHRLESSQAARAAGLDYSQRWIAEQLIEFEREISIVVARTASGNVRCFPVFENSHHRHILDVTVVPANISETLAERASEIAIAASKTLDVVGLLCVEFFVRDDDVLINEVAPRPHNSGHLTIEASHTSQFEQHVRAICDLPLGDPGLRCGAAAMANLLGDLWADDGTPPDWNAALAIEGVSLHLYGKTQAKPGRKMGHLTAVGRDRDEVAKRVRAARSALQTQSS